MQRYKDLEGQIVIHAPEEGVYQIITPKLTDDQFGFVSNFLVHTDSDETMEMWIAKWDNCVAFMGACATELPKVKFLVSHEA